MFFSFEQVYYSIRLACLHDSKSSTTMPDKYPISVFRIIKMKTITKTYKNLTSWLEKHVDDQKVFEQLQH